MQKYLAWSLSICFLIILSTPLLLWVSQMHINPVNILENRKPVPVPDFGKISWTQWPQQIEKWTNDNIPLRSHIVSSYMKLWEWYLHTPVLLAFRGKEGHLFLLEHMRYFSTIDPSLQNHLYKLRALFLGRQIWFEKRGSKYLLVLCPTKETMLYEYLPQWAQYFGSQNLVIKLEQILKETKLNIISLHSVYRDQNIDPTKIYFQKNDPTHYNILGFHIGYQAVESWIKNEFNNNLGSFNINNLDVKSEKISYGPFGEEIIPHIDYPVPNTVKVEAIGDLPQYAIKDDVWLSPAHISNTAGKKRVIVATDSFFNRGGRVTLQSKARNMLPTTLEASEAIALHYESFSYQTMSLLEQKFKPDLIIEEHAEVQLQYKNQRRQPIEVVLLGEKYLGALQLVIGPENSNAIKGKNNISQLDVKKDEITIKAINNDPYILFSKKIKTNKDGYAVVAGNMIAPYNTASQLFYWTPGNEWQVATQYVSKGNNFLYFQLNGRPETDYEIRFDPGQVSGEYTLSPLPFLADID